MGGVHFTFTCQQITTMTQQQSNPWYLFLIPAAALVFGLTWINTRPPSHWAERREAAEQAERNEIDPELSSKLKQVYTAKRAGERAAEFERDYKRSLESRRERLEKRDAAAEADRLMSSARANIDRVNRWLESEPSPALMESLRNETPEERAQEIRKGEERIRALRAELEQIQNETAEETASRYGGVDGVLKRAEHHNDRTKEIAERWNTSVREFSDGMDDLLAKAEKRIAAEQEKREREFREAEKAVKRAQRELHEFDNPGTPIGGVQSNPYLD